MLRHITLLALLIAMAHNASATITRWGGTGGACTISNNTVMITAAGEYKFYSETNGSEDEIDWIRVSNDFSGTVTLHIVHENDGVGASNVKEIDITETTPSVNITGNLARLYISGNLATEGDIDCDNITGNVTVAGTLGDGPNSTVYDLNADTGTGNVSIVGDCLGALDLGDFTDGDITIGGLLTGDLTVDDPGAIQINSVGRHDGNITFAADCANDDLIRIGPADPADPSTVQMYGNINLGQYHVYAEYGHLNVNGDMYGTITLTKSMSAEIRIAGSLYNDISIGIGDN